MRTGAFDILRIHQCGLSSPGEMAAHEQTMDAALTGQMNQADSADVSADVTDMTSAAMTTVMTTVLQ